MSGRAKKWLVPITWWALLFLGFIGLFLPVLQGILFIVMGLVVLSAEYTWAHHLLERAKTRFPHLAHHIERAREFLESRLRHLRRHLKTSARSTTAAQPFRPKENPSEIP